METTKEEYELVLTNLKTRIMYANSFIMTFVLGLMVELFDRYVETSNRESGLG